VTHPPHLHYPMPPGQMPFPPPVSCRCGLMPVAFVTFRTQTAFLFGFHIRSFPGPWCHTCGTAVFRMATTLTLARGWWSLPSLLITNPYVLAANLRAYKRIKELPEGPTLPQPPLRPGPPVHRRPAAYLALVPLIWAVWFVTGMTLHVLT
jgi:hypothetical protein